MAFSCKDEHDVVCNHLDEDYGGCKHNRRRAEWLTGCCLMRLAPGCAAGRLDVHPERHDGQRQLHY